MYILNGHLLTRKILVRNITFKYNCSGDYGEVRALIG